MGPLHDARRAATDERPTNVTLADVILKANRASAKINGIIWDVWGGGVWVGGVEGVVGVKQVTKDLKKQIVGHVLVIMINILLGILLGVLIGYLLGNGGVEVPLCITPATLGLDRIG